MISVILYGRNDAHGYNLHRRAALSFNCIAECLTNDDDEIIFVDYNTPDELPTFVEAISDTLTDRCVDLLRVLRVPAAMHRELFAARTHLSAIEPVARNAGVRRANPSNRWLLSTNTDMVLLPLRDSSLSDICGGLADGFYGMPRFELPEWLWERLPRSDPGTALAEVRRLGPGLRLDEPTVSHEWIRFDAPGDFQLILRDDFVDIDAFNEDMLLGYHVDSNLSRRLYLRRGSIESLDEEVAGYHCNHNRVPTAYHGARVVSNDLQRFFYSVDCPDLPDQRGRWGLAGAHLDEIALRQVLGVQIAEQVSAAIQRESAPRGSSNASEAALGLTYDSAHVLSFVADSLAVSSPQTKIAYIGGNAVLEALLSELVDELPFCHPLLVADLDEANSIEQVEPAADFFVVDLGVDEASAASLALATELHKVAFPARLDLVFAGLEHLVELERRRLARGKHPRRIVLVNSATAFWDAYVLAELDCSHTSVHSRVRRATVKATPDRDNATAAAKEAARQLIRWAARGLSGDGRLHLRAGTPVAIAELDNYQGFGEGWALPDRSGIWTQGARSELAVALDGVEEGALLAVSVGDVCVRAGSSINVEVFADGERIATCGFGGDQRLFVPASRPPSVPPRLARLVKSILPSRAANRLHASYLRMITSARLRAAMSRFTEIDWRIEVPAPVAARRTIDLTFVIDEPQTPRAVGWSADDERLLGLHLRSLALQR